MIAIIELTAERATELLGLMNEITIKASRSSKAFKISSFEPSALYAPARCLERRPERNDFIVLAEDYTVSDITPVKVIHADVMPFFVIWEAYDRDERFKLTTAELGAEVLKFIARGGALPPGATSRSVKNGSRPANDMIITKAYRYIH